MTATFSWDAPASGTIGFGFNADAAMIQCGALNYGSQSPTFTAPSSPGRYYLSIDNPNTCQSGAHTWASGVPGASFARYIGAVDVTPNTGSSLPGAATVISTGAGRLRPSDRLTRRS